MRSSPFSVPTLEIVEGAGKGSSYHLAGTALLGRDPNCSIVLRSQAVSRRHARIVPDGMRFALEDLGSTQGTLINGRPAEVAARLEHGDRIQLGDCLLMFWEGREDDRSTDLTTARILQSRESSRTGEWVLSGVRAEEKLRAILDISKDLAGTLDLDDVLNRILEGIFRLFPQAGRGFVVVAEGDTVVPVATRLRDPEAMRRAPSLTVLAQAIGTGQAILCEDIQHDPTFGASQSVGDAELHTLMCVPLRDRTRASFGAIHVDTSDQHARFTSDDLDLLAAVAAQVGMVIENARLNEAARDSLKRRAEMQAFVDSLLAAAPVAMAFLDPGLRLVRVSRAMAALMPAGDHIGADIASIGGELTSIVGAIVGRVAESGERASGVEIAVGQDGHWLCHCYPTSGPGGDLVGVGIILEDIAQERAAVAALRDSERHYRHLFEANPHPMWVYDVETLRFLAVNTMATVKYGYTSEDFLSMTIEQIRPAEDVPALRERVGGISQSTHLNAGGWRHLTKSGELLDVEISSHSLTFGGRRARLVLASDVTLRRRAETELVAAKEAAVEASRAKDRFLAVLSHELRTPLTPALLAASALVADQNTPGELRETLEMISRNLALESKLVDDLLNVARIERGHLELELGDVDVHRTLREAADVCEPEIRHAGLSIEWSLGAGGHHVRADSARLRQVFWNLISNAARYARAGTRLRICSGNERGGEGGRLILEFADTGMGFDPAFLPRIFEPFTRGESQTRERPGGLGLGLSISRSIIDAHGGRLTAESEGLERGATFRIELATIQAPSAPAMPPPIPVPSTAGVRILAVEDNADTLRYLKLVLGTKGFNVVAAANLREAREAMEAGRFDLLISDIELPDGTGLELMFEMAAKGSVPGIAISGFGSDDDVRDSLQAGFSAHLTKPVDLKRLEAAIARTLAAKGEVP